MWKAEAREDKHLKASALLAFCTEKNHDFFGCADFVQERFRSSHNGMIFTNLSFCSAFLIAKWASVVLVKKPIYISMLVIP